MELNTISRQLFYVTVRIEGKNKAGDTWSGTGFLYDASSNPESSIPFLVSNKHVLCNDATELIFHLIDGKDGKPVTNGDISFKVTDSASVVIPHSDPNTDVAVVPFGPVLNELKKQGKYPVVKFLDGTVAITNEQLKSLDAYQDVMFVGYPTGLYDRLNLTPILRRASTATPLQLDYNGDPTFVIDGSVYGGSSGSPVLIVNIGGYTEGGSNFLGTDRVILLGVLAAVHLSTEKGRLVPTSLPNVVVDIPNGLGLVYKWQTVEDTIDAFCNKNSIVR